MLNNILKKIALWLLKISGCNNDKREENVISQETNKEFKKISIKDIRFLKRKSSFIPKQIFFVNLGQMKPFMNFCIQSFRDLNPTFKIDIYNYDTPDDLYKDKNVEYILSHNKTIDKDNIESILYSLKYRLVYLNGGIYSSLYNYCIKPLDDLLLYDNFITSSLKDDIIYRNNYMFGVKKSYIGEINNMLMPPIYLDDLDYQSMKLSFSNCNLSNDMFKLSNNKLCCPILNFES